MKHYPTVLTIAGSDSGGGAGIQADIKAISATGSYAASAITAVTVQNTLGVEAVHPVPADIIRRQILCVLSDIGADAVKIGMLHSAEVVLTVRDALLEAGARNIVLDPVMVSTSGHRLIEDSAVEVLARELIPLASVITPNIPEAEILSGRKISGPDELQEIARLLSRGGSVSVLMKAGHLEGDMLTDWFFDASSGECIPLPARKIDTPNTHGTGCTLSSALASFLARGFSLPEAARLATSYIHGAIVSGAGYKIGGGHGPVNHFYEFNDKQ